MQDISNIDVLEIIDCLGTPFEEYNDRPLSADEKSRILAFINSGKGFYFSGDWSKSDLPKYNDIANLFCVSMETKEVNYIPIYEDGYITERYLLFDWYIYVFEYINYFQNTPSQAIYKKEPLYGYSSFSNANHEIFNNVNQILLLGSSFLMPKNTEIVAGIKTHPTTTFPRDFPITQEDYPLIIAKNYGSGRVVISCDSNCFANDGFAKSEQAGTDNKTFAKNVFRWLAGSSSQGEITEIKIKDMASGEFVDSTSIEMSSIKGTKSFKAIGFNNGTEIGPVNVNWSLIGGDVASGSIREGILKELDVNVGKIGAFTTAEGAKSTVENAEQVDFVSYLSSTPTGDIRIQAAYGSLTPVDVSIRLKQPKISIKINKLDTVSDSLIVPEWIRVTQEVWATESLFLVNFINTSPEIVYNETFSNPLHLDNSYEEDLKYCGKFIPDLDTVIVFDTQQDAFYGGIHVFTRQLEKLLSKNRGNNKAITVTITNNLIETSTPLTPLTPYGYPAGGWTPHSKKVYKRIHTPTPINDSSESGISLANIVYTDTNFRGADSKKMAHEIGHILIRGNNDHFRENGNPWNEGNVMIQGGSGRRLEAVQWVQALGLNGDTSYFVEEE